MKISTILFDFDGVLVDSGQGILDSVKYALTQHNIPLPDDKEIMANVGWGRRELIENCVKSDDQTLVDAVVKTYGDYYDTNAIYQSPVFDGVIEVLEHFSSKRLIIVTNKTEYSTWKILEENKIKKYFARVIGPESVTKLKPDPEGINKIIEDYGLSKNELIMIGDTYSDIETGKAAGVYTCGVTYGIGDTELLKNLKPDFLIDDIRELKNIIE